MMRKNSFIPSYRVKTDRQSDKQQQWNQGQSGRRSVIGPSTGAAHPPLGIGENGRGMGTLALTLKEESRRDLNFLSAHTVHMKFEDSLHNWHWQPHPFLEFCLNPRTKEHPECGGLTLVLFNFPNHTHWS